MVAATKVVAAKITAVPPLAVAKAGAAAMCHLAEAAEMVAVDGMAAEMVAKMVEEMVAKMVAPLQNRDIWMWMK